MSHIDTLSANDLLIECSLELKKRHPNEFPALNFLMHRIGIGGLEKLERKAEAFDRIVNVLGVGCIKNILDYHQEKHDYYDMMSYPDERALHKYYCDFLDDLIKTLEKAMEAEC